MTDHDAFEQELRDHFARRADDVAATPDLGAVPTIETAARATRSERHRRRMAAASVATVAAVAAGLFVIARDPAQDVRTRRDGRSSAASGLAAGAATGSSTGTSTGSPTGWTGVDSAVVPPTPITVSVPAGYQSTEPYVRTIAQGATGARAADLAVAADAATGAPLRFVVASVQDATRLRSGTGGTAVTIGGRPGRIISRRAAVVLTWDLSATERVLVTAAGVPDADLERWLASLTRSADGRWTFDGATAPADMTVIPTVTPVQQWSRTAGWQLASPDDPCHVAGFDLFASSGGSYELWARLADDARWSDRLPELRSVSVPGVAIDSPAFVTQWGGIYVQSGDTVVQVNQWATQTRDSGSTPADIDELISRLAAPAAADPTTSTTTTGPDAVRVCKDQAGADSSEAPPATDAPSTTVAGG